MGVYIPDMEIPGKCESCPFISPGWGLDWYCPLAKDYEGYRFIAANRMKTCPLIAIPGGHGRLIDADEFRETFEMDDITTALEVIHVRDILSEVPTIISAERRE